MVRWFLISLYPFLHYCQYSNPDYQIDIDIDIEIGIDIDIDIDIDIQIGIDIGVDSDSDIHTDIDKQPCTYLLPLLPLLL